MAGDEKHIPQIELMNLLETYGFVFSQYEGKLSLADGSILKCDLTYAETPEKILWYISKNGLTKEYQKEMNIGVDALIERVHRGEPAPKKLERPSARPSESQPGKQEPKQAETPKKQPPPPPQTQKEPPEPKKKLVVGNVVALAAQYGIPAEIANLFFMTFDGNLYIKNPGLLYLANKKGYSRIEITDEYDEKSQEWVAQCKVYPKLTPEQMTGIGHLDVPLQERAFQYLTAPTNGTGRAGKNNVKMSTMQPFLREMAQTRAMNRALRAYTGYGSCSAEELPTGEVELVS